MSLAPIVHHAQGPTATSLPDRGPSPCFLPSFMPSKLCFGDSRATFAVPGPGAGWAQCWWRRKDSVGVRAPCSTSWAAHSPLGTIPLLPPPHPSMHQGYTVGDPWCPQGLQGPMCPLGPSPHSVSPMVSPRGPVCISAHRGASSAMCAPWKRTQHQEPILPPHTSSEQEAQPPRREVEIGFNRNTE